jgi:hypothetical protein
MRGRRGNHGDTPDRRFLPSAWWMASLLSGWCVLVPVEAAVYYVDGNCPSSGSGATTACGSSGPKKSVVEGLALLAAPGDVLQIRGAHAAHDTETANFDGRYFTDGFNVTVSGSTSSSMTIQPYGYAGPGTGEKVYMDGTKAPSAGWTQCSTCTSGVCAGVPSVACNQTWYTTDNSTATKVIGAQKDDGSPTFRVTSASDLINGHSSYNSKRCSINAWKACNLDGDCGSGETCTATSAEIDSYSPQTAGSTILVRWGSSLPNRPYVFNDNNGSAFMFSASSSNVTIQGFNFRCFRRSAISIGPASGTRNIVVVDNRIFYGMDVKQNGSDYGLSTYGSTGITFQSNEIAYTGSEGIHPEPGSTASVIMITGNYIHHQGDQTVLGPGTVGTPSGMILAQYNGSTGPGDFKGSVVSGNLIAYQSDSTPLGSVGRGIIVENNSNNWIIRDNVFYKISGECIKLTPAYSLSTSGNVIFNNLFVSCGLHGGNVSGNGPGIWIDASSGTVSASNNVIYNNTFVNNNGGMIALATGGAVAGNLIRNNLGYDSGSKKMISWASTDVSNVLENNLVMSAQLPSGNPVVTWQGARASGGPDYTCGQITNIALTNKCTDPKFVNASSDDYHIQSVSPAKDAGTSTGMPATRTASIYNLLAGGHGLPSYADKIPLSGLAWDMGAIELGTGSVSASITLSDPSPTAAGNVVVTLTASVQVVQLPGPLVFVASDGSTRSIALSGSVPGTVFRGTLVVDSTVPDGLGTFVLPAGSLVDGSGNIGNTIVSGAQTLIDETPPLAPANLRVGS